MKDVGLKDTQLIGIGEGVGATLEGRRIHWFSTSFLSENSERATIELPPEIEPGTIVALHASRAGVTVMTASGDLWLHEVRHNRQWRCAGKIEQEPSPAPKPVPVAAGKLKGSSAPVQASGLPARHPLDWEFRDGVLSWPGGMSPPLPSRRTVIACDVLKPPVCITDDACLWKLDEGWGRPSRWIPSQNLLSGAAGLALQAEIEQIGEPLITAAFALHIGGQRRIVLIDAGRCCWRWGGGLHAERVSPARVPGSGEIVGAEVAGDSVTVTTGDGRYRSSGAAWTRA